MPYVKFKLLTVELNYNSVVGKEEIEPELLQLFDKNEEVFIGCKATSDLVVLTDKRIMILDRNKRFPKTNLFSNVSFYFNLQY